MKRRLLLLGTAALIGLQLTMAGCCGFHHRKGDGARKQCCCKCVTDCPKAAPATPAN